MTYGLVSLLIQVLGFVCAFVAGYCLRASHEARRRAALYTGVARLLGRVEKTQKHAARREGAPWN